MAKKFYVTTAIDYVDDVIHIGHSYQKIVADALARYHRLIGDDVFFLTGSDEHGSKVEESAKKAGFDYQKWADKISAADIKELQSLNISFDRYIRTTDLDHIETVNRFFKRVRDNGDVYLGKYTGIYCQGCEGFITEKDLVDGKCPYHPKKKLKKITEKNYFFRWSRYENFLRKHLKANPNFILPESRKNEMLSFLDQGLQDIPISRPNVEWGIPVPGDPEHTIYVWFDALINYISGAPKGFWPADLHLLGKDNVRWHALLWPAMLKSAGYELPKTIYGHGFISLEGKKISKSLGNIIRPSELVKKFDGADPVRYYLLKVKPLAEDGDLSFNKMAEVYNADLANGLGNLCQRVAALAKKAGLGGVKKKIAIPSQYHQFFKDYRFNECLAWLWQKISQLDQYIDQEKPWEKSGDQLKQSLARPIKELQGIGQLLKPFLPETAARVEKTFTQDKIKSDQPLFPRLERFN